MLQEDEMRWEGVGAEKRRRSVLQCTGVDTRMKENHHICAEVGERREKEGGERNESTISILTLLNKP